MGARITYVYDYEFFKIPSKKNGVHIKIVRSDGDVNLSEHAIVHIYIYIFNIYIYIEYIYIYIYILNIYIYILNIYIYIEYIYI